MLKTRLFGLVLVIIFAGMIYYGWYQLREEGVYYMKMASLFAARRRRRDLSDALSQHGRQAKHDEREDNRVGCVCDRDLSGTGELVPDGSRVLWFSVSG